jgi:hypothetical protein
MSAVSYGACAGVVHRGSAGPVCAPISPLDCLVSLPDLDVGQWEVRAHGLNHCHPRHRVAGCCYEVVFRLIDVFFYVIF